MVRRHKYKYKHKYTIQIPLVQYAWWEDTNTNTNTNTQYKYLWCSMHGEVTEIIKGSGSRIKEGEKCQQGLHPFPLWKSRWSQWLYYRVRMKICNFLTCTDRLQYFFGWSPSLRRDPRDPEDHTWTRSGCGWGGRSAGENLILDSDSQNKGAKGTWPGGLDTPGTIHAPELWQQRHLPGWTFQIFQPPWYFVIKFTNVEFYVNSTISILL